MRNSDKNWKTASAVREKGESLEKENNSFKEVISNLQKSTKKLDVVNITLNENRLEELLEILGKTNSITKVQLNSNSLDNTSIRKLLHILLENNQLINSWAICNNKEIDSQELSKV